MHIRIELAENVAQLCTCFVISTLLRYLLVKLTTELAPMILRVIRRRFQHRI